MRRYQSGPDCSFTLYRATHLGPQPVRPRIVDDGWVIVHGLVGRQRVGRDVFWDESEADRRSREMARARRLRLAEQMRDLEWERRIDSDD